MSIDSRWNRLASRSIRLKRFRCSASTSRTASCRFPGRWAKITTGMGRTDDGLRFARRHWTLLFIRGLEKGEAGAQRERSASPSTMEAR